MKKLVVCCLLISTTCFGQDFPIKKSESGIFALGVRSTVSIFNGHEYGNLGTGYGGQFRLQFAERINSEWYLDYLTGSVGDFANRTDYHIGWSVMYYFLPRTDLKVKPYIIAGHCFDQTELYDNRNKNNTIQKRSSAIQTGAGVHFNLSPRLDLTFVGQYMFHLGDDIHADTHGGHVHFENEKGAGLEGHFLFNLSFNYKIADLW